MASPEIDKKIEEFVKQFRTNLPDAPETALKHLNDLLTYCEGITDNERNPITKMSNQNTLFSLFVFQGLLEIAIQARKKFESIESRLNNFEERIKRIEDKVKYQESNK